MSLRDQMPITAAFIDQMREAFGIEPVDAAIRAGLRGEPDGFYAQEAGRVIGTQPPPRIEVVPDLSMVAREDAHAANPGHR